MKRESFRGSRTALILSALLVVLVSSSAAFAQQGTSTIRGSVKDPQGNVVAGATITLTNMGTSTSRQTTSSENGGYSFESVPVGDYKIETEAKGFKKGQVTDVHASVSAPSAVDIQLELGNVSEVVTVSAGSAELLVNREDATLGNTFVNKQITQLPLEARSIPNLLTLQAATTRDGYVAGARADQSNITLDGVDINEAQTNQIINPNADPANGSDSTNLEPDRQTVIRLNSCGSSQPIICRGAALLKELTNLSASELVRLIIRKQASPVEVAQAHLERIEQLNPALNAIVTIAPDVLDRARQFEASLMSGDSAGPLHGLPITIKDTIETADLRSTSGSVVRAQFVPLVDAPAVARLRRAGAIILGKTNVAEMAMDYTADNPVFGRTNNPHDTSRTPGGSSGGEAAAIATCLSAGGLGSDLAGSIRIPAHFCGIAGLKPTTGSVPDAGQFPPSIGPYSLGAAIGPMARRVEDLQLLFSALRETKGSFAVDPLLNRSAALRGCRVAWYTDDDVAPVTEETRRAVACAASALNDAGLITEQRRPPGLERGYELWLKLFSRASVVQLRNVYTGREDEGGDFVRWRLATADDTPAPTLDEYINAWMERDRLKLALDQWMTEVPLLVAPVGATPALKHDTLKVTIGGTTLSTFRAFSYSQAFNVFDLPGVSVPAGVSAEGLPIGVQIVGRPFEEEAVLLAAAVVEEALGGWQPPKLCERL